MKFSILSLVFAICHSAFAAPQLVSVAIDGVPEGAIVIKAREHALYLKMDERTALRYRVATPKSGMEWGGQTQIASKQLRPAWVPPAVVKRAKPGLPNFIAGGAHDNPMGAAALTLGRHEIAIHGTSASMRRSIGTAASFGCIRMLNEDVLDLFDRVSVGTPVYMMR